MSPDTAEVFSRIIESSPVIVLFLGTAVTVLWRALREEQKARNDQHEKTIEAVRGMTHAVHELTVAIRHPERRT